MAIGFGEMSKKSFILTGIAISTLIAAYVAAFLDEYGIAAILFIICACAGIGASRLFDEESFQYGGTQY